MSQYHYSYNAHNTHHHHAPPPPPPPPPQYKRRPTSSLEHHQTVTMLLTQIGNYLLFSFILCLQGHLIYRTVSEFSPFRLTISILGFLVTSLFGAWIIEMVDEHSTFTLSSQLYYIIENNSTSTPQFIEHLTLPAFTFFVIMWNINYFRFWLFCILLPMILIEIGLYFNGYSQVTQLVVLGAEIAIICFYYLILYLPDLCAKLLEDDLPPNPRSAHNYRYYQYHQQQQQQQQQQQRQQQQQQHQQQQQQQHRQPQQQQQQRPQQQSQQFQQQQQYQQQRQQQYQQQQQQPQRPNQQQQQQQSQQPPQHHQYRHPEQTQYSHHQQQSYAQQQQQSQPQQRQSYNQTNSQPQPNQQQPPRAQQPPPTQSEQHRYYKHFDKTQYSPYE